MVLNVFWFLILGKINMHCTVRGDTMGLACMCFGESNMIYVHTCICVTGSEKNTFISSVFLAFRLKRHGS